MMSQDPALQDDLHEDKQVKFLEHFLAKTQLCKLRDLDNPNTFLIFDESTKMLC